MSSSLLLQRGVPDGPLARSHGAVSGSPQAHERRCFGQAKNGCGRHRRTRSSAFLRAKFGPLANPPLALVCTAVPPEKADLAVEDTPVQQDSDSGGPAMPEPVAGPPPAAGCIAETGPSDTEAGASELFLLLQQAGNDRQVLEDIYNFNAGADLWGDSSGWMTDAPLNTWCGVIADAGDNVTSLTLANHWNIMGTVVLPTLLFANL
jgi:hypothetical protein